MSSAESPDDYEPATLALRCPYCGSTVEPVLEYTGYSHSEHRDWVSTDCEGCLASWDHDGQPVNGPHKATLALRREHGQIRVASEAPEQPAGAGPA